MSRAFSDALAPPNKSVGPLRRTAAALTAHKAQRLAHGIADCLRRDDLEGVLDVVYGQRTAHDDKLDERVRRALRVELVKSGEPHLAARLEAMSPGQQVLFEAYLRNPDGRALPEDLAELAIRGNGSAVGVISDVYAGLRARYADDEAGYASAADALDKAYALRYGGGVGLRDRLINGPFPELDADDRRVFLAARHDAPEALELYEETHRAFGADATRIMESLLRNSARLPELADSYALLSGGQPRGDAAPIARLRTAVHSHLPKAAWARSDALLDVDASVTNRIERYLRLTLTAFADGTATADDVQSSLRRFAEAESPAQLNTMMDAELTAVRARALADATPIHRALLAQLDGLRTQGVIDTPKARAATLLAQLEVARGDHEHLLSLAPNIAKATEDERGALRAALPRGGFDAFAQQRGRGSDSSHRARAVISRLDDALAGRNQDPGSMLWRATRDAPSANASDVLDAICDMPTLERGDVPRAYDAEHGPGAWRRDLERLPNAERDLIRVATTLPADSDGIDAMVSDAKNLVDRDRGALSAWMLERFGFSQPAVGNATRELVAAARAVRDVSDAQDPRLIELVDAYQRFVRAIVTENAEREAIADNAQLCATITVGLLGGFSLSAIVAASAATGSASVAARWSVLGDHYSALRASRDFVVDSGGRALEGLVGAATPTLKALVLRPVGASLRATRPF